MTPESEGPDRRAPSAGGDPGEPSASPQTAEEAARARSLDLRVAEVIEAGPHPNADRLLLLRIDLGGEQRQIVAGIAGQYTPDELTGHRIVVVANLQPARLRGEVSEGMLLAVESDEMLGLLLAPGAGPGTPLRVRGQPSPADRITIGDFQRHELVASPDGVRLDGEPLEGARLVVDRGVYGRLR